MLAKCRVNLVWTKENLKADHNCSVSLLTFNIALFFEKIHSAVL